MSVSALIITLREGAADGALQAIAADPRFVLGPRDGTRRAALVLDAPDLEGDRAAHDWLRAQQGVDFIDVVAVYLDPEAS